MQEMPAATTEEQSVLTRNHIAKFAQIVKLREENQDLISYAFKFYRDAWPQLMECCHCVSDEYTTTASNKQRMRELIEQEEKALAGLKKLIA